MVAFHTLPFKTVKKKKNPPNFQQPGAPNECDVDAEPCRGAKCQNHSSGGGVTFPQGDNLSPSHRQVTPKNLLLEQVEEERGEISRQVAPARKLELPRLISSLSRLRKLQLCQQGRSKAKNKLVDVLILKHPPNLDGFRDISRPLSLLSRAIGHDASEAQPWHL